MGRGTYGGGHVQAPHDRPRQHVQERGNYRFIGWNKEGEGIGTSYQPDDAASYPAHGNMRPYAQCSTGKVHPIISCSELNGMSRTSTSRLPRRHPMLRLRDDLGCRDNRHGPYDPVDRRPGLRVRPRTPIRRHSGSPAEHFFIARTRVFIRGTILASPIGEHDVR